MPTSDPDSAHAFLRRETAKWHQAVEAAFAGLDLQSREGLATFLTAQAEAVLAIEDALDGQGIDRLCPDWVRRKRGAMLSGDLLSLGCRVPAAGPAPRLGSAGRSLGALYVLEGSRLGGKLLARRIRQSRDPTVRTAVRFLEHEPEPQAWTRFCALLNGANVDRQHLLEGAESTFGCFRAAARACQN